MSNHKLSDLLSHSDREETRTQVFALFPVLVSQGVSQGATGISFPKYLRSVPICHIVLLHRKREVIAYFRIPVLEYRWNKISDSLTPDPERIQCEEMPAHSLPIEFSRFVFENKPTLPCFMSERKYIKFPEHIHTTVA